MLELSPKTAIPRPVTRAKQVLGALAFAETAKAGAFFAVGKTPHSSDKFTIFAIAPDNLFRISEEAIAADEAGHLEVKVGVEVVDAVRYACVSPGGTVFTPTKAEVVVPQWRTSLPMIWTSHIWRCFGRLVSLCPSGGSQVMDTRHCLSYSVRP